ncbi:MAG: ATP-binding protein [Zoogloeaceae bacterium]|jgi:anti-sigma regulatory factor (Ser/Thr protein kinase)|nr:ATP-binding protein [Zoogloeaceae bacterium]
MSESFPEQLGHQEILRATARPEQLEAVMDWLAHRAETLGLDGALTLRMQLVLEELFLNTLLHGYAGDGDNIMELELKKTDPRHVWLVYTDYAPAFNPCEKLFGLAPADPERLGGKGLYLIRDLSASVEYQALNPGNRIRLGFYLEAPRAQE